MFPKLLLPGRKEGANPLGALLSVGFVPSLLKVEKLKDIAGFVFPVSAKLGAVASAVGTFSCLVSNGFLSEEVSKELSVVSCFFETKELFFIIIDSCWLLPARIKTNIEGYFSFQSKVQFRTSWVAAFYLFVR